MRAMASINMHLENLISEMAFALKEKMGARHQRWAKDTAVFVAADDGTLAAIDNELHFGSASEMTSSLLGPQGIAIGDGDIVACNDPYLGSAHVQDFYVLSPVYHLGRTVALLGAKAHMPDIGGNVQGGFNPQAEEVWAEGARFTPLKICREGRTDTYAFNMILLNSRSPDLLRTGLDAMIAALESGRQSVQSLLQASGEQALTEQFTATAADTAKRLREIVSRWPAGEYADSCPVRDGRIKAKDLRIQSKLTVVNGAVAIDLSANPAQLKEPYNSSRGNTLSFALMPFFPLLPAGTAINGGIWKVLRVTSAKGTVVDPVPPAPTAFCPFHVGQEIATSVMGSLNKVLSREDKARLSEWLPGALSWHPQDVNS